MRVQRKETFLPVGQNVKGLDQERKISIKGSNDKNSESFKLVLLNSNIVSQVSKFLVLRRNKKTDS